MLKAEEAGISAEQHIDAVKALHQADFASFNIAVDNYYSTRRVVVIYGNIKTGKIRLM